MLSKILPQTIFECGNFAFTRAYLLNFSIRILHDKLCLLQELLVHVEEHFTSYADSARIRRKIACCLLYVILCKLYRSSFVIKSFVRVIVNE